jgi:hypothetical protein
MRACVVLLVAASAARAQPVTPEAREAGELFRRARAATAKGDHATACPLYEQSFKLVIALGTELNLAECWVQIGHFVDAVAAFRDLERRALEAGQTERAQIAREGIAKLEPRLPHVTITVSAGFTGRIVLDERSDIATGTAVAVDPGAHEAVAIANDGRRGTARWVAAEAKSEAVHIDVAQAPRVEQPMSPSTTRRNVAFALAGTGAASALAGGVFMLVAKTKRDSAIASGCMIDGDHATCPDAGGAHDLDTARVLVTGATIAASATILLGGISAYLFVTSRSRSQTTALRWWADPHGGGVVLDRRW